MGGKYSKIPRSPFLFQRPSIENHGIGEENKIVLGSPSMGSALARCLYHRGKKAYYSLRKKCQSDLVLD